MRRLFALMALAGLMFVCAIPAHAQIGLFGSVSVRREVQEDHGDFRFTADLFANADDRVPYWGYLAVSKELLLSPNAGRIDFGMVLVTPDGKPVSEARWTEDQTIPYDQWHEMPNVSGKWILSYLFDRVRPGTKTIIFGGKIKKGKGTYTKLWFLAEFTFGNRKDKRQADALQFMVYDIKLGRGPADPQLLANAQEKMGAGGKSLIGPVIEDEGDVGPPNGAPTTPPEDRRPQEPLRGTSPRSVPVEFVGFSAWTRVEWDNGRATEQEIAGLYELQIPEGCRSFNLYILERKGERGGVRVKHNGREEAIPTNVANVTVRRTAR